MSDEGKSGASETKTEDRSASALGAPGASDAPKNGASGNEKPAEGEKKPEAKAAEGGADEKSKPALVDDKWEPKPVEGVTRDAKQLGEARALFKKLGLTTEQSQALVDYSDAQAKLVAEASKAKAAEVAKELEAGREKGWNALKSDKDIGGSNFEASIGHARRAIDSMGAHAQAVRDRLFELGLDNDAVLVRGLIELGSKLGEDTVSGTADKPGAAKPDTFEDRVSRTYSKTKES